MNSGSTRWRRCAIAAPFAIAALVVVIVTDVALKHASGVGVMDIQHAPNVSRIAEVLAAWRAQGTAAFALAGFSTGFDTLFVVLYTFVLWQGGIAARDTFAPTAGPLRVALGVLALTVLPATVLDLLDNVLMMQVLAGDPESGVSAILPAIERIKWIFAYVSITYVAVSALIVVGRSIGGKR